MSSRVVRAWVVLVRRGYRTMVASMVSLRAGRIVAELACSPLGDRGATSLGLGATARTSAASVTFCVVDPGFVVDPGSPSTLNQPQSLNQPR
jgi:hypothetical protein